MIRRWVLASIAAASLALSLAACGLGNGGLQIGSTNFTESRILANLYMLALQHDGMPATVKELTTREIVAPALEKGQLQIEPDYLGTFAEYLNAKTNGPSAPPVSSSNVEETWAAARKLAEPRGLTILAPARAQDQNAFAVLPAYAQRNNLKTLSQLGTFSHTNSVTLGAGPDCPSRPRCAIGLEQTYGIKFANFVALDTGGPLTIQALLQNKIQVALVFSSSGMIAAYHLVTLDDDKDLQTADNIIPVVNTAALQKQPGIKTTLDKISAKLTTEDLQQLNAEVDLQRKDPRDVAQQWLQSRDLV
jgi:osmoprotectant transport system substrate-binding protein